MAPTTGRPDKHCKTEYYTHMAYSGGGSFSLSGTHMHALVKIRHMPRSHLLAACHLQVCFSLIFFESSITQKTRSSSRETAEGTRIVYNFVKTLSATCSLFLHRVICTNPFEINPNCCMKISEALLRSVFLNLLPTYTNICLSYFV